MRLIPSTPWLPALLLGLAGLAHAAEHSAHHHDGHAHRGAHAPAASAADTSAEPPAQVKVEDCWIRALPGQLPSAGYFKVRNESDQAIALTGVRSEAYGHAMLHATREEGGMSRMVHADAIDVPAGGEFAFTTGNGYHIMLEGAKRPLEVGASETLVFLFDRGGPLPVSCAVKAPSALE